MKIIVLGVSGMLGSATFRLLSTDSPHEVWGTERGSIASRTLQGVDVGRILSGVDVNEWDSVARIFDRIKPDAVINCVGVVKQLDSAKDPLVVVPINTLLPHRLHKIGQESGCRLVHVSTDCVFAGDKGNYAETDRPDAVDLYGLSKYLGEVEEPSSITLRTSIIGHELASQHSLLCWFLAQRQPVRGFARAIFSGLPTVELARVIRDFVLPKPDLYGLYHVSASPISKYDLLQLFAAEYGHLIPIERDELFALDRSLDSSLFQEASGYHPPEWPELVARMRRFEQQGTL